MSSERLAVEFHNGPNRVAADLHLPEAHRDSAPLPAIVLSTPGSSVKEQIGANYARRLADRGFAALTFDPSFQGESEGTPRDLEDPAARVEDLRCAIDHLTTRPEVDATRIALLGICAGGGYAVRAAVMDGRVAALGTVVGVDIGRAMREATGDPSSIHDALVAVGAERTAAARGAEDVRNPWIPDSAEDAEAAGITDRDVLQAIDFYRTPRGFDPHSTNRLLLRSMAPLLLFDAFFLVDQLLTVPLQVVVGSRRPSTGSRDDGERLQSLAPHAEEMLVIDGVGHYELYDQAQYVDQAVDRLADFYATALRTPPTLQPTPR